MQNNQAKNIQNQVFTSKSISFRYLLNGESSSSSYSVSPALIGLLADAKKISYDSALEYCTKVAKEIKESEDSDNLSQMLKLRLYSIIIDSNLLLGYEVSVEKEKLTVGFYDEFGNRKTTLLKVPSIIMYGLSCRYSNANYEVFSTYQIVRDDLKDCSKTNFEEAMRFKLLILLRANKK